MANQTIIRHTTDSAEKINQERIRQAKEEIRRQQQQQQSQNNNQGR